MKINGADQGFHRRDLFTAVINTGRVNYEPNSFAPGGPREVPSGFATHPAVDTTTGTKVRVRSVRERIAHPVLGRRLTAR